MHEPVVVLPEGPATESCCCCCPTKTRCCPAPAQEARQSRGDLYHAPPTSHPLPNTITPSHPSPASRNPACFPHSQSAPLVIYGPSTYLILYFHHYPFSPPFHRYPFLTSLLTTITQLIFFCHYHHLSSTSLSLNLLHPSPLPFHHYPTSHAYELQQP